MAPSHSPEGVEPPCNGTEVSRADSRRLVALAAEAVAHGVNHGAPMALDPGTCPPGLRSRRASFVTLQVRGGLRGCIGSLQATRPLGVDVADNAYAAAFRDPRFRPLARDELAHLNLTIAVLSPPEPVTCAGEDDLIDALRPGVDGLILRLGSGICATFLPAVWAAVPDARAFLRHLKAKAGLPESYWSPQLVFQRYTVQSIT